MSKRLGCTASVLAALPLLLLATNVSAQSSCAAPGVTVLEDPAGDWTGTIGGIAGQGAGLPEQDLIGVSVYQSTGADGALMLNFRIQVASGPTAVLPPAAAWYTSFQAPDGPIYGVRLQTDGTGASSYFSYLAGASNAGTVDGRFVTAGSEVPAVSGTGPDADGNIDIAVKAENVGVFDVAPGTFLLGFNAATTQSTPVGVVAFTVDEAPTGLDRGDAAFEVKKSCDGGKSAGISVMAGAPALLVLLPLGLAGLLRRRRA